jgi:hypothetical protein
VPADTLTDFVLHFIDEKGLAREHVLTNSLPYPLFGTRKSAARAATTLSRQEPMPGAVPENPATELGHSCALERIVFNDERLLRKVAAQYPATIDELAARLDAVTRGADGREAALDELHRQHGPLSTAEDYRRVLGVGVTS